MILKDLIDALEHVHQRFSADMQLDPRPREGLAVRYGFGKPFSWRGIYAEVCFEPVEYTTVGEMLEHARSAVGATFTGWKGGEFTMSLHTPCHVNFKGECGDDAITPFMLAWMLDRPVQMWDWEPLDVPWKVFWA